MTDDREFIIKELLKFHRKELWYHHQEISKLEAKLEKLPVFSNYNNGHATGAEDE